ncbi:hypothetical protein HMPREF1140_0487 [Lachnoanaerobaculum sp. ICM7]|nr:hypothetical protein HMPREF1140_0487 [Lachnoanaerobaculum sp. ICM7]
MFIIIINVRIGESYKAGKENAAYISGIIVDGISQRAYLNF